MGRAHFFGGISQGLIFGRAHLSGGITQGLSFGRGLNLLGGIIQELRLGRGSIMKWNNRNVWEELLTSRNNTGTNAGEGLIHCLQPFV